MNAIDFDAITQDMFNAFAEVTVCKWSEWADLEKELKPDIKKVWIP